MAKGDFICIKCKKLFNEPLNQIGTGICPGCLPAIANDYNIVSDLKAQNKPIPPEFNYLFDKTEPAKQ